MALALRWAYPGGGNGEWTAGGWECVAAQGVGALHGWAGEDCTSATLRKRLFFSFYLSALCFVFCFGRGTLVKLAFFAHATLAANFPAGQTLRSAPLKNSPPPCLHKKFYLFTNAPPKHSPLLAHGCTYGASTRSQELGMSLSRSHCQYRPVPKPSLNRRSRER